MSELILVANAGDGTVSALRLHREPSPSLEVLTTSPVGPGCGTFAVDTARGLVHAAYKGDPAGIVTLRLDPATGALTELSRRDVPAGMTYLELSHEGSLLLGASYGGGLGLVWPVEGEALGEPVARLEHANLHCVVAAGGHAHWVSLGEDLVASYAVAGDGSLTPLDPPTTALPSGSGPRHLLLQGSDGYLVTEFSGEVFHLIGTPGGGFAVAEAVRIDDPAAGLAHSRYGADPRAEHLIWGADVHRAGPWLLASERTASTLVTVTLGPGGQLGPVVALTPTEEQPRGFAVTADGAYVVAVGERSTYAALSRVTSDGTLAPVARAEIGRGANWVRIVPE